MNFRIYLRVRFQRNMEIILNVIIPLKPSGSIRTTYFNILKFCILTTQCICMFHMVLTVNSDFLYITRLILEAET
jgi:hypothetical protein